MTKSDPRITSAVEYIKSQHNGEIPYKYGYFECARLMVKYKECSQADLIDNFVAFINANYGIEIPHRVIMDYTKSL